MKKNAILYLCSIVLLPVFLWVYIIVDPQKPAEDIYVILSLITLGSVIEIVFKIKSYRAKKKQERLNRTTPELSNTMVMKGGNDSYLLIKDKVIPLINN